MAERDVIYRLKAVYDQSGSQAFAAMASSHAAAIKSIEDRWKAFDASMKAAAGTQADAVGRSYGEQKNHAREFYDYVGAENKKLVDAIKQREKAEELARRASERAMAQTRAGNAQIREGLLNTAEGVARVVRGYTLLGFVSDENLAKLLKTLAAVQGVSDIVMGSVKAYTALQKAVDGYTLALNAAKAAEAARAAAGAGGAAAGAAGAAGAGAAGGLGLGQLAIGGAAAAAAIGSLTFAIAALAEFAQKGSTGLGSIRAGEPGSITAQIGYAQEWAGTAAGLPSKDGTPYTDAYEAQKKTSRVQKAYARMQEDKERIENNDRAARELEAATEQNRRRQAASGFGESQFGDDGAHLGSVRRLAEIEKARERSESFASSARGANDLDTDLLPKRIHQYGQAISAEQEILNLTKQQAEHQLRISQIAQEHHRNAIGAAQQELDLLKQQRNAVGERYQSAQERFGAMNPMEQRRTLSLSKKAQEADELRKAGFFEEADRITKRFTLGDLNTLGSLPLKANEDIRSYEYQRRADAAGFGDLGTEERRAVSEVDSRIESLVAEKELNFEAKINLVMSDEQIKRALTDALAKGEERVKKLADEVVGLASRLEQFQRNSALNAGRRGQGG